MKCTCGDSKCKATLTLDAAGSPGTTYICLDRNDDQGSAIAIYLDANSTQELIRELKNSLVRDL